MTEKKITVATTVNAPASKVWEYWTKPQHITKWNFAIDSWHCPEARNDLRVGGKYFARMEAKDGTFGFDFEAVYNEVVDQKKISYTLGDGRVATTDFESTDGTTKVTTRFDAETENDFEMQRTGWQAILDNFRKYVESN
jgi:uncharacterized protein YndB with AHSA1/START domain